MKKFALTMLAVTFVFGLSLNTARAIAPFKKEFDELYVKDSKNEAFVAAAKKANCLICHGKNAEGKEDKKVRNAYGKALDKLLDKKDDAKNVEKIRAALETVAKEKSNPDDASSPTFGELLSEGKLPSDK
ncbi:MAG TPA: hypothetical protein VGN12_12355 [Pirellulales bacterium]|jgi:cytochrome c553